MSYFSPFVLLGWFPKTEAELQDFDVGRAIQMLLAEFELANSSTIQSGNTVLDKDRARCIAEELLDAAKRHGHFVILQNRYLMDFLTDGALRYFETPTQDPGLTVPDVVTFISPHFAEQFSRALLSAYAGRNVAVIGRLCSGTLPIVPADVDHCMGPLYGHIDEETVRRLGEIERALDLERPNGTFLCKEIDDLVRPDLLNALPPYFQELRNKTADKLTAIACKVQKSEPRGAAWKHICILAHDLLLTGNTKRLADDNHALAAEPKAAGRRSDPTVGGVICAIIVIRLLFWALHTATSSRVPPTPRYTANCFKDKYDGRVRLQSDGDIQKMLATQFKCDPSEIKVVWTSAPPQSPSRSGTVVVVPTAPGNSVSTRWGSP